MRQLLKRRDFSERALLVSIAILLILAIAQHFIVIGHPLSR
jgi:hypothetical protein